MVDMNQLQALFGGTFDPIHYGHLKPVEALANQIGLSRVIIMPNNVPPIAHSLRRQAYSVKQWWNWLSATNRFLPLMSANCGVRAPRTRRKPCRRGEKNKGQALTGLHYWSGLAANVSDMASL
jgi:cytidyltransferase-like protein